MVSGNSEQVISGNPEQVVSSNPDVLQTGCKNTQEREEAVIWFLRKLYIADPMAWITFSVIHTLKNAMFMVTMILQSYYNYWVWNSNETDFLLVNYIIIFDSKAARYVFFTIILLYVSFETFACNLILKKKR